MNRTQAKRRADKLLEHSRRTTGIAHVFLQKAIVSELLRIDKAAYKRGVKDGRYQIKFNQIIRDYKLPYAK